MAAQYDDADDIMAAILGGQQARAAGQYAPTRTNPLTPPPTRPTYVQPSPPVRPLQANQAPRPASYVPSSKPNFAPPIETKAVPKKHRSRRPLAIALFVVVFFGAFCTVGYTKREHIMGLLMPGSPFAAELKGKVNFPLYYPTKLPKGFLIELDSISQPQENVLAYNISDDSGQLLQIVQQPFSQTMDLEALLSSQGTVEKFDTTSGRIVWVAAEDGTLTAHYTTSKTWLTLTTKKDILNAEQLKVLFQSLKEG